MFNNRLRKIGLVYLALQAVIWAKCIAFFLLFGFGKSMDFNAQAFPAAALLFDFFFHNAMHVGIGILALLFGKNMQKIEWIKLVAVVFVAVALHNALYWFTASHPTAAYSAFDFARDSGLLLAFVVAGFALKKVLQLRKRAGKS